MASIPSPDVHRVQQLFLRHSSRLHGFIRSLYPDENVAQDLLHEVFLTLVDKAEQFEPGTDFLAWARAVARLKVLESLRRRTGATLSEQAAERLAGASDPFFKGWEAHRDALRHCIGRLTAQVRRMVDLRYADERNLGEIAAAEGWSIGAVKVALSRARASLRDCIQLELKRSGAV